MAGYEPDNLWSCGGLSCTNRPAVLAPDWCDADRIMKPGLQTTFKEKIAVHRSLFMMHAVQIDSKSVTHRAHFVKLKTSDKMKLRRPDICVALETLLLL